MPNIEFGGFAYDNAGDPINGATVNLYDRNTTTPSRANTTTDANGWWTISHATEGRFDIAVTSGSTIRRRKYDTREQLEYLEVANFRVRNPADTFEYDIVPAAIIADRQLNLPLITATDTLVTLGLAQAFTAAQQFTTLEVGHATDTTLARASAGDLSVEANRIFRVGGADVPVADGGTALSTIAALSLLVANNADTFVALTPAASQSIRINAGNTAWEAFTPNAGTVTSVTGTAPVASSGGATPAISITGVAGQVLAGAGPAFTATPTLGASGTLGSITMGNATSGTIVLQPVTGALGTVTVSLPAATDTLVGKATTDVLTNKSLSEAQITFTDITTGNATTTAHGYLLKLGGGTTNFLRADGTWAAAGAGAVVREGGNTTEATSTSTTTVTLLANA